MKVPLLALAVLAVGVSTASAYTIILHAPDYIASHNEGGADFYITPCGGASNGLAVEGYDYAGDWIELKLVLSQASTYWDSLRSAADDGALGSHKLTIFGPGGEPVGEPSTYQTEGLGIG
jgi:hypothetical protein